MYIIIMFILLYLGCLGSKMPTGPYISRRAQNGFLPERRTKHLVSFIWLDYLAQSQGLQITHALNAGREIVKHGHKVDG